jgi:large subunit ribosomal protein L18
MHAKIHRVSDRARLSVFRSLNHFYAQIVDDTQGTTLCSCSTRDITIASGDKKARARAVGLELARRAKDKGIANVVFDRGSFLYHGRVKNFAEGAREGGLLF